MGISNSLIAQDVPDLSLRNTFSPQLLLKDSPKPLLLKDSPNTPTCAMCKYTIYNLDCGHAAEDHVDSKDCPYFQKTDVACDRDNPANRSRVSIKSEDRNGLCNHCRRRQHEIDELKAISRDQEREKQQKLAEAEEARRASKAHEERFLKDTAEEYARMQREQEQKDIELALQQSREAAKAAEAARLKQEQEDLARALRESQRNVTLEKKASLRPRNRSMLLLTPIPRSQHNCLRHPPHLFALPDHDLPKSQQLLLTSVSQPASSRAPLGITPSGVDVRQSMIPRRRKPLISR